jgi:hypothetical protein
MAKLLQGDWLKVSVWNGSPVFVKQVRLGDTEVRLAMYFMKSSDPSNVADSSWYISASEPLSFPSGWQADSHLARAWPKTEGSGTEYHMATMRWQVLWADCSVQVSLSKSQLEDSLAVLQSQLHMEASEVTEQPDEAPAELDTPIG